MQNILLIGAGKSATVLIDYLKGIITDNGWTLIVADADIHLAKVKVGNHPTAHAVELNILHEERRQALISQASIVISMMPPHLHEVIAKDCAAHGKHLLTASYVAEGVKQFEKTIQQKGLLFLCEMGLDPGIDHMSSMEMIHDIHEKGGTITSFKSHCGGLVAPESDDNPWHYKISWNPRNVVLAGKAGATYKLNNEIINDKYEELFNHNNIVIINEKESYSYYANRDSLSYIPLYGLENAATFLRTTLRHPDYCTGWKQVVDLNLTSEEKVYNTTGMSIAAFFETHFTKYPLPHDGSNAIVDKQFSFLGLNDHSTIINKGLCSAADIMQFILEKKLAMQPADKDMIVMLHEFEYELNGEKKQRRSLLKVIGEDALHTAMAKTVGLPLGIAAKLILEGKIKETGLQIPVKPSIYKPVLEELSLNGISFKDL
ncbi:MAG: saccharopine dehydrogenase NADP-binding domain-containing protein [Sphingobacteriia bacterium]|nr:saccharopine dehydrogenase NADP-binding domain-containing protein [Sphingobacteriia bacterium]